MITATLLTTVSQRWASLLELVHDLVCRECGKALSSGSFRGEFQVYCLDCLRFWGFSSMGVSTQHLHISALCQLTSPLKKIIYGYKFYGGRHSQQVLRRLWLQGESVFNAILQNHDVQNDARGPVWVVSIPSRYRNETIDSSSARPIERLFSLVCRSWSRPEIPVCYLGSTGLEWQRDTWPQHRLTQRKERLNNMHQALAVNDVLWQQRLKNQGPPSGIVVLDDLVTTGATAQAALSAVEAWCKAQGFSHIPQKVLALAYVPLE
ncbi:MAG: hypothetical protein QE263_00395 [Vampirovibrionales bacterium]|nr:hypothetical protein [Vampirovibrionales bacterium]